MTQLAYLVIREGSKWSDVFRLVPGQSVTVGRAPTNQVILKDEHAAETIWSCSSRTTSGRFAIWKAATARWWETRAFAATDP